MRIRRGLSVALALCAAGAVLLPLAGLAETKAGAPALRISRALRASMLHQPESVPVLIRWKLGRAGSSHRLGRAVVREIPLFGLTAARLPAARIEKLARSRLVEKLYSDVDSAGGDGKETPDSAPSELDRDEKGQGSTWGLRAIHAMQVWKELKVTGAGVRVGIVDSGIDPAAYPGRVLAFRDFSSEPVSTAADPLGHGTHVAGTIGGDVLPGNVHFGVAPGCRYVIGRAIDRHNSLSTSQGIKALEFVADPDGNPDTDDGARVVNCSFSNFPREDDELWTSCIEKLRARNIFPVFSAANNGAQGPDSVGSPGVLSCSFTIGAVGPNDKRWEGSSYSASTLGNHPRGYLKPDLMGPGVDTLSLGAAGVPKRMSGTSMATPHVVGVVALMLEANPRLTVKEIGEILEDSAVFLGDRWKSSEYGSGLVNAFAAVKRAHELLVSPPPPKTIAQLLAEGQAAVDANNLPRAVDRFIAVINLSGSDITAQAPQQAMFSLSAAYAQQGNYRAAVNGFRKMLEIAPQGSFAARARFELAMSYRRTPTADAGEEVRAQQRAAQELAAFLAAYPDDPRAGEAMDERAMALADAGQLQEAKAQAQAVLAKYPDRPEFTGPAKELLDRLSGQAEDPLS